MVLGISGGNIVGSYYTGVGASHGFIYDGSSYTTLNEPDAINNTTHLLSISGSNMVGEYEDSNGKYQGFIYNSSSGTFATLKPSSPSLETSGAYSISGSSVVGQYVDYIGNARYFHGYLYDGSTYTTFNVPTAWVGGSPYGAFETPRGISGNSIFGTYTDQNLVTHGFIYDGSNYTMFDDPLASQIPLSDLPVGTQNTGTNLYGISGNTIVGSYSDENGIQHGFVYDGSAFTTVDNPLGVKGSSIFAVDGDTLVGSYTDENGIQHGFEAVLATPEPSSVALLVLSFCLGGLGLLRRRKNA